VTAPDLALSARYRHPHGGRPGRVFASLLHAAAWTRIRRALMRRLPMPALVSDVRDVVYLSWWVDLQHAPPAPPGFQFVSHQGRTPYTILTYRHGHFGPAMAGPLRGVMPSPLQSNWRWYLRRDGDPGGTPVVLFDRNLMDSLLHVVAARASSDAMQPHLPRCFAHVVAADGSGHTRIDGGQGSAPSLDVRWQRAADWTPPRAWADAFLDTAAMLDFIACQDEAIARTHDAHWAATRIALPVALDSLQPLQMEATVLCPHLQAMGVEGQVPLAFRLPAVPFRVVSERLL